MADMTNYERITSMSVEEMAELIIKISGKSTTRNILGRLVKDVALIDAYKEWLESEAEEWLTVQV